MTNSDDLDRILKAKADAGAEQSWQETLATGMPVELLNLNTPEVQDAMGLFDASDPDAPPTDPTTVELIKLRTQAAELDRIIWRYSHLAIVEGLDHPKSDLLPPEQVKALFNDLIDRGDNTMRDLERLRTSYAEDRFTFQLTLISLTRLIDGITSDYLSHHQKNERLKLLKQTIKVALDEIKDRHIPDSFFADRQSRF